MIEPVIECPHCHKEIKLTESLAAPLVEATRLEFEQKLAEKDSEVARREVTNFVPASSRWPRPGNKSTLRSKKASGGNGRQSSPKKRTRLADLSPMSSKARPGSSQILKLS